MLSLQIKQLHDFSFSIIHPFSLNQVLTTNLNRVLKKVLFRREKGAQTAILIQDLRWKEKGNKQQSVNIIQVSVEGLCQGREGQSPSFALH